MSISALLAVYILVWGGIECSIAGLCIHIGHPNEAILIVLVTGVLYVHRKYGLSLVAQLRNASDFLSQHRAKLALVLVVFAYIFLLRIKIMQHLTFHTGAYDLAMYDTAIRNTLHGKFMFAEQLGRNFFSEHFSPILLLFCPLYSFADTPLTLLVVEALCLAAGLWFIYKIARHYYLPAIVAFLIGLIFLNYKYLARGVMFDFHPEMMEPTFLLACIYFLLKRYWWPYFGFLVLALACKEDIAIYTLCLGLYSLFNRETRYAGLATCSLSLAWAVVAWVVIIPGAMPDAAGASHFMSARWGHLGDGYAEVAIALLKRPIYIAERLLSKAPVEMLALLAFIPLLGIEILLLAVPGLALNTTTTYSMQAALKVHYAAPIIPFMFWAFILGLARLRDLLNRFPLFAAQSERSRLIGLAILLILTACTFGADYEFYSFTPHVQARYHIMKNIESNSTISCGTDFVPHLSRVAHPFVFPVEANHDVHYRDCEYILVDKLGDPWPLQKEEMAATIAKIMVQTNRYELLASKSGVFLFANRQKGEESNAP